jgi:DNA polymerase delta subunit 1
MPGAIKPPPKRVLAETTNTRQNIAAAQPSSAKKRKLDGASNIRQHGDENVLSSQPKSQFEEQLEKLSQNINGLKQANAERDQVWDRPPLTGFNPNADTLCFQQIEAEEGTLAGGKQTVRLFGVTEVSTQRNRIPRAFLTRFRMAIPFCSMSMASSTISM